MGILCRSTLSLCAINGCCCLFSYGCLFLVSCVYRSVTFTLVLLCILFYIFYRCEFDFLTNAHFKNAGLPTTLYFLYLWFNQYNTTYFVRCCSVFRCFVYWFEFYESSIYSYDSVVSLLCQLMDPFSMDPSRVAILICRLHY